MLASTTFIENVESDDDESSSYEKKFVRGVATPTESVTHSSSSSVTSPALTPSIGAAANTTEDDEEDDEEEDPKNVTLSPNEVVVIGNDTTFVTSSPSPDMTHVSVVVVGGTETGDICVIDSSLSSNGSSSHHHIVTPSRNDIGRSSSSASHASSLGGQIIPPPKSYSSSISDDDRNNDVSSPCSIVLEGTTVDDTEDNNDIINYPSSDKKDTLPNGHVDSEEDSGVHVMAKSVDEFQELPHDEEVTVKEQLQAVVRSFLMIHAFLKKKSKYLFVKVVKYLKGIQNRLYH